MKMARWVSLGVLSLSSSALGLAACSATPPAEDPLMADPPVTSASTAPATSSKNPDLVKGELLLQAGKPGEALPLFKAVLTADPKSAEAAFYMAVATEQTQGDPKEVERLYKQAITFDPKLVDAALNLGAIYLAEPARPDEAIATLDKALAHSPGDPKLLINLGYAYSLKKEHAKAVKALQGALPNEDTSEVRLMLGMALFDGGKQKEAVPHLLKAASTMKDDAPTLATVARMVAFGEAFEDCVKLLDRAIKLKGDDPEWYVRRGTCKHELGKEKEAGEDFQAAIKLEPKFQAAHYYLAMSLLAQGRGTDGRLELKKTWELGKDTKLGKLAKDKLEGKAPKKPDAPKK